MIDNYEIYDIYFVDNEKTTVEILWKDLESEKIVSEYVEAKDNDDTWKYVKSNIGEEVVHENTYNRIKALRNNYEKTLEQIAKKNGDWIDVANDSKFIERLVVMLSKEENDIKKEELFKFKLAVFEDPKISESKNNQKKAEIRKAKTYLEIIKAIGEI